MQIHRLKLSGLQELRRAGRKLRIEPGLTGVVGPKWLRQVQTCSEAIRWVMGENLGQVAAVGRDGKT